MQNSKLILYCFSKCKNFFFHSNVKSLTSFTLHLTFDKQLSKVQKILNDLPDPTFWIRPNPNLILKLGSAESESESYFEI